MATMKKLLISLSVALLVLSNGLTAFASFSDVKADTPYRSSIDYVELNEIFTGDTFEPSKSITRGEFAEWALRNAGFVKSSYTPLTKVRFKDVSVKKTAHASYIYKLIDVGVIHFTDFPKSEFKPDRAITRAEAIDWLFSLEGVAVPKIFDPSTLQATDLNANSELAPLAQKAIEMELLEPGKVGLKTALSRAQAAHFLEKVKLNKGQITIQLINGNKSDLENRAEFDTLVATWNRINSHYLRENKVDQGQLVYGAIEGMVKELGDKHTTFERPGENGIVETLSNKVEGIGAVLQEKDGHIVVVTPLVGSPAEKAGLLPNDIIVEVDGAIVKDMSINETVAKIKGKKGSKVKIKIQRGTDKFITLNITRDVVEIKSVVTSWTDDNIFTIRVTSFGETTSQEFNNALKELEKKTPKGIIIDLRFNPGGYLTTVTQMVGHFIEKGKLITTVKYPDHEEPLTSAGPADLAGKKLVVLINSGSASASEIFAGALKDYKLATIVGEVSYGKGTVQELDNFSDGSLLKLTIAEWLTPLGNQIDGKGVTPDVVVKNPAPTKTGVKAKDLQQEKALEIIRGK